MEEIREEKDALEERLATKRLKKRTYKANLIQLREEFENVKKAYTQHDQDRERDRERMHDVENELSEKILECKSKEVALHLLTTGLSSVTPVIWKLEKAIAWYRKELPATREEVARLTKLAADQAETIKDRDLTLLELRKQLRHVEAARDQAQDQLRELEVELEDTRVRMRAAIARILPIHVPFREGRRGVWGSQLTNFGFCSLSNCRKRTLMRRLHIRRRRFGSTRRRTSSSWP